MDLLQINLPIPIEMINNSEEEINKKVCKICAILLKLQLAYNAS